jgi:hypothetical protein
MICFSWRASAVSGHGTEIYEDEVTLTKDEYARAAREVNVFLEKYLESCSKDLVQERDVNDRRGGYI